MDLEDPASRADVAELGGEAEQPEPELEEDVIITTAPTLLLIASNTTSMG